MFWIEELITIADDLDNRGLTKQADAVDGLIKSMRTFTKDANYWVSSFGPTGQQSTRYCPDHHGVQAKRIGDHKVQCPLDGKEYDYIEGYKTYDGDKHPGAYPSYQTPNDASFYGAPHTFLEPMEENRQKSRST